MVRIRHRFIGKTLCSGSSTREAVVGAVQGGVSLAGADLRYADLSELNLNSVDLSGACLRLANFRRSDLRGANFSGADLSDVNFMYADLRWANFCGANVDRINVAGVDHSKMPLSLIFVI